MSVAEVVRTLGALNVADLAGLGVLAYGVWKAGRGRPRGMLYRARQRSLEPLGVPRQALRRRVRRLLGGETFSPADELNWLAEELGLGQDEAVTFQVPEQAARVAAAYRRYAAELETGALLGATHAPVVRAEAALARSVSSLADGYDALTATTSTAGSDSSNVLDVAHRRLVLEFFGAAAAWDSPLGAQHLFVSYRDTRLFAGGSTPRDTHRARELTLTDSERVRLDAYFSDPHSPLLFDGALPRLVASRAVRHERTGRRGLHLLLAETTYGAWVADHYPHSLTQPGTSRALTGKNVRGLTLSCVVLSRCGHLLFARRSDRTGSHQGLLGPAINGNLEFDARRGLSSDMDEDGLPDPRAALAREAREELGLQLRAEAVTVTGLARFRVPTEVGAYVLLSCVCVDEDRDEVLAGMRHADPIEGAWENDRSLVSLRVPATEQERALAVDWLVGAPELTAHATAAGLGALSVALREGDILRNARSAPGVVRATPAPPLVESFVPGTGWTRWATDGGRSVHEDAGEA